MSCAIFTIRKAAFYSAEDADSPDPDDPSHSGEGAFYIWSWQEIERLLGADTAKLFARQYGIESNGNVEADPQGEFIGRNILYRASVEETPELAQAREILLTARNQRPRPHLDNKVLSAWNALMISALAKGYAVLGEPEYREAAKKALDFLLRVMYDPAEVRLRRRYCEGEAAIEGFLDDYAFLAQALLDVFEITFDPTYLDVAQKLATTAFARFEDNAGGSFYSTAAEAPDLLLRVKDDYDGAEPSGNSIAVDVLIRLARITGNNDFEGRARRAVEATAAGLRAQPAALPRMLAALGHLLTPPAHTIIRCSEWNAEAHQQLRHEWKKFEPNNVVLLVDDRSAQFWSTFAPISHNLENKGRITIYRCENFVCSLPEVH